LDRNQRLPQAEYLLGSILEKRQDYRRAVRHLRRYLQLAPRAPNAAEVQSLITKLES
jgi:TolA-binding protein